MTVGLASSLCACLLGLTALCVSMGRHHDLLLGDRPSSWRRLALRATGWISLALSFLSAASSDGVAVGPVRWLGASTMAAIVLVALLSYRPRWVVWIGLISLPMTLTIGLLSWLS